MRWIRRLWWELTRPRGPVRHRFYRGGRSSRSGVALLLVIANLLFMTVIVSEITYAASVRIKLAAHQRDEAKAEALARSGADMYRLILVGSKMLGKNPMLQQYGAMLGINGDSLWQMIPFFNTNLMRMLLVSDGDDDEMEEMERDGLSDEQLAETREGSGIERNFLDFDGDFAAEMADEEKKINIARIRATDYASLMSDPIAVQLHNLMSGRRQCGALDNLQIVDGQPVFDSAAADAAEIEDHDQFFYDNDLERWELIANLADWVDADSTRMYQGGQEETVYQQLEQPYMPKNAPFESLEEVRLVDGWHLDKVWERYGEYLTVYGNGKVNINTAECDVLWALLQAYITPSTPDNVRRVMVEIETVRAMGTFTNTNQLKQLLDQQGVSYDNRLLQAIGTESTVFRVESTGQVGDASVRVDAVYEFSGNRNDTGKVLYWRVE